jgi:hypothetical protein
MAVALSKRRDDILAGRRIAAIVSHKLSTETFVNQA